MLEVRTVDVVLYGSGLLSTYNTLSFSLKSLPYLFPTYLPTYLYLSYIHTSNRKWVEKL